MDRSALDEQVLRTRLGPRWAQVDVVAETASTNADLLARRDAPDRSVLVAELQTAGRGRFDRTWTSPPGAGLTFSALFRPAVPLERWGWLPLLTGVALAEAVAGTVAGTAGISASLKWPNDLLVDGRKAAGILVQSAGDAAVVGIGVNVSTTPDELPVDAATSLGPGTDRTELLIAILTRLDARVAQWADVRGDAAACGLAAAYRERCSTIGAEVRVSVADGEVVGGVASDVDDDGHLVVGGETIGAGDVVHVRPSG